ncbi:hypothetical protein [Thermomonospora umbrina]|uniref:Uncharacterized protein n=1 Tax=Thermomonospora umbrina TaxID=111806 RepID=A0A3D9SYE6_9ACTN|nr:hypothetical protein [Thermomonospora umbrina]REF00598.1 hypothetical protein DFJ69_6153 [Thermomonospora umbrina]
MDTTPNPASSPIHLDELEQAALCRRGAYEFLRRYAPTAWTHEHGGKRWHILMPADVARLPEPRRYRVHARQEARRVNMAELFVVCPRTTERAVSGGRLLFDSTHQEAVEMAERPNVLSTAGITPPARHGFVVWQAPAGVGAAEPPGPVVACHWGPLDGGGTWIVWWSDQHAANARYRQQARAEGEEFRNETALGLLTTLGRLLYDTQQQITPCTDEPIEHPQVEPDAPVDTREVDLLHTTLATWELLSGPVDGPTRLTRLDPEPHVAAADRRARLNPALVTYAHTPAL